ncbi:hypothetical protein [Paraburkholderia youngii]|uniref:hypothetical protein n=1 Tax=Paraburkholderia youngii TaxID=2782701 RepID=UPI003D23482A
MNNTAIPLKRGPERTQWLESLGIVPVLAARDLWDAERTPEAKHVLLHLRAFLGDFWLHNDPPQSRSPGVHTGTIAGYISEDQRISVWILRDRHEVEVRAERGGLESLVRLQVPGEIVGIPDRENYRGIFFSLERGERHANLYDLLGSAAAAVVVALDLVDLRLGKRTAPAWRAKSLPSWRERDLPAMAA